MRTAERAARIKPVPAQVQLLEKQLLSADAKVRQVGIDSIPDLGAPAEPLANCISGLLEHQNWYVRQSAAFACARAAESPGAADAAIRGVAGARLLHNDAYVRTCAGRALITVTQPYSTGTDDPTNESDVALGVTAEAAGMAAQETAAKLSSEDQAARETALETLSEMGACAAPYAAQIGACVSDPNLSVRNAAIEAFAALGAWVSDGSLAAGEGLSHSDAAVRRSAERALVALSEHSGEAAATGAAAQLEKQDAVARHAACVCLAKLGPLAGPHGKSLSACLEDIDSKVRLAAQRALVNAGPNALPSLEHIRKVLNSNNPDARRTAVDTMRGLSAACPQFAQAVGRTFHEDSGVGADVTRERIQAVKVLGGAGANARPYLRDVVKALEAVDIAERRAAIEALEDLGEHAGPVAEQVARCLLHADADVRRAAAEALSLMGVHAGHCLHRLEGMVDTEEDPDVRHACEQALELVRESGAIGIASPTKDG